MPLIRFLLQQNFDNNADCVQVLAARLFFVGLAVLAIHMQEFPRHFQVLVVFLAFFFVLFWWWMEAQLMEILRLTMVGPPIAHLVHRGDGPEGDANQEAAPENDPDRNHADLGVRVT